MFLLFVYLLTCLLSLFKSTNFSLQVLFTCIVAYFCVLILQVVFVNSGHLVVVTVSQTLEELMSDTSAVDRYVHCV